MSQHLYGGAIDGIRTYIANKVQVDLATDKLTRQMADAVAKKDSGEVARLTTELDYQLNLLKGYRIAAELIMKIVQPIT